MKTVEERAATILCQAEVGLRQLVAESASAGDYAGTIKIAAWARTLSDLAKASTPHRNPVSSSDARPNSISNKAVTGSRRGAARSTEPKDYPRFFRHGDQLIRVAWSKREKKEYQHKAPHHVLAALATALVSAGKEGRVFATEQVLPISDPEDGREIPNYQAYVGIAWFKHAGLIEQHGRQGYSVPQPNEMQGAVESIWQSLPPK